MNKRKIISAVVAVAAGLSIAFLFPKDNPVTPEQHAKIKDEILPMYPTLQPIYDQAMEDGVLTKSEAKIIIGTALKLKEAKEKG